MPDIFIPNPAIPPTSLPDDHYHPFAAFCTHPYHVTFKDQEPDEKLLLLLRRHFITNVPWIILLALLFLTPFALLLIGTDAYSLLSFLPTRYVTISLIFYYLLALNYGLIQLLTWYYNIFLVTHKRVVDIDFSDIVYHNVAMTKLIQVENVNYTQVGFIPSFFNYGDVFVETAGASKHFEALSVPKPAEAVVIIQKLMGGKPHA